MELKRYLDILGRRATVIAIVTALTISLVATAGLLITPIYTARSTVRVIQDVGVLELGISGSYGERLMNTYSHVLTSSPVLEEAAGRLGRSLSIGALREKVEIEVIPDTELMRIAVQDSDPAFARDLANTLVTLLVERARNLYAGSNKSALQIVGEQLASLENSLQENRRELTDLLTSGAPSAEVEALRSQIEFEESAYNRLLDRYELARLNESLRANSITIVEPAFLPSSPSNALGLKEIGIGLVVGLAGGVGLALVLENLDTRILSPLQLEHLTRLPILGTVPRGLLSLDSFESTNGTGNDRLIAEAYRLLSTNLQALRSETALKTILITSPTPKEGKSTTAASLAQVLAERGQTVFLVESDLRRPSVAKMLDIEDGHSGLSNLLSERAAITRESISQVICPAKQPSLFVISAGSKMTNPTAYLDSPSLDALLDYLGTQGQTTLLDAPPVMGVADVSLLAPKVDGVILVVGEGHSRREQVLAALKQLQASRARVIGSIFLEKSSKDWGYGYK
jgi:succinoglycan biosynthesis transport protein ExoP